MSVSKKEMLARTAGIEDVSRVHTASLEKSIKEMTAQRTNVNLSAKDKQEMKILMQTKNLSEAIRSMLREIKRARGL